MLNVLLETPTVIGIIAIISILAITIAVCFYIIGPKDHKGE